MSTYTKGPWRASFGEVAAVLGADSGRVAIATNLSLHARRDGNEVEANARLIAAAPELLEALQQCFDYPADVFSIGDSEPFTMTITGRHLRLVRAAIQKATAGEQQ
jgi:hypothetical protein